MYEPWAVKNEQGELWGVKIKDGKFAETVISINNVKLEDDTAGEATLDFTFINKTEGLTDDDFSSSSFNETISNVINDILNRAIELYENENRKNDSTESNSQ